MAGEWTVKKIGDFATAKGGKRLPKGVSLQIEKNDHPYIRVVDFTEGIIQRNALLYVPCNAIHAIRRYTVEANDVIISIVGTIGAIAQVPKELHHANLTENAAKLLFTDRSADAAYIAYFLKSSFGQHEIAINTVGSTQPKLPLYGIENIKVSLPPLKEQQAIACILGSLDDKLELNRRMNRTLEAMAQAIFKSWFVDFDPVRAKAEGRDSGLPKKVADLFTDSFDDSDTGEIPKGWHVGTVGEVCQLAYGKALKADQRRPGNVPVMGSNGQVGAHDEALVKGPGIVVGRKGIRRH